MLIKLCDLQCDLNQNLPIIKDVYSIEHSLYPIWNFTVVIVNKFVSLFFGANQSHLQVFDNSEIPIMAEILLLNILRHTKVDMLDS